MGVGFGPGVEWGVRPFAAANDLLQRYVDQRPPENQDNVAEIRWGKKSTFGFLQGGGFGTINYTVIYPIVDPGDGDDVPIEWYDQVAVDTEDVRVENPDDSEQFVIDQRMTQGVWQSRDTGKYIGLTFDWDAQPTANLKVQR